MQFKQNKKRIDPRYFLHEARIKPKQIAPKIDEFRKIVLELLRSVDVDPEDISQHFHQLTKGRPADKLKQALEQGEAIAREFVENYVSRSGRRVSRDPRQMNLGLGDIRTISQEIRTLARRSELATARRALRQHGTALEGELSIEGKNFVDHSKAPDSPKFKEALSDVINKVQLEVSQGKQKDEVIKNMFLPFAVGALSATGVITVIEQIIDSANETVAAEGEGEPAEYPEELETVGDQPEVAVEEEPWLKIDDLGHADEPEAPNLPDESENWSDEQFNDWLEKMGIEAEPEPNRLGPPRSAEALADLHRQAAMHRTGAWRQRRGLEPTGPGLPSRVGQPMREDRTLKESNKNIYRIIREETRRLLKQRGII